MNVLVLGCGPNPEARYPKNGNEVWYIDNDPLVLQSWKEVKNQDVEQYPWNGIPTNHFDLIIADGLLEHIQDIWAFMKECHRVLKPLGRIKAQVPYWRSEMMWNDPDHVRGFAGETMHNLIEQCWSKYGIQFRYDQKWIRGKGGYSLRRFIDTGDWAYLSDFVQAVGSRQGLQYTIIKWS